MINGKSENMGGGSFFDSLYIVRSYTEIYRIITDLNFLFLTKHVKQKLNIMSTPPALPC